MSKKETLSNETQEAYEKMGLKFDDVEHKEVDTSEVAESVEDKVDEKYDDEPDHEGYDEDIDFVEEKEDKTAKFTDEEKQAYEHGWRPDAGPKSAGEFLRTYEYMNQLQSSHSYIKELKSTMKEMSDHMAKQQEIGYKQALEDLHKEKIDAIHLGDVDQVREVEEKITALNEERTPKKQETNHPSVDDFYNRHRSWIQDPSYEAQKMRNFALERQQALEAYDDLETEEVIKIIETDLRKEFPDKFENHRKKEPPKVESAVADARSNKSDKLKVKDLDAAEKQVFHYLDRTYPGTNKAKNYLKQLAQERGME